MNLSRKIFRKVVFIVLLLTFVFIVLIFVFIVYPNNNIILHSRISQYNINPYDILIENDSSIVILGDSTIIYTENHKLNQYKPIILKSNDGGRTWSSKSFAISNYDPRFFLKPGAIILYNYELEKSSIASVYLSNDIGESWVKIGEQELFRETPAFGNFKNEQPDIKHINKVSVKYFSWRYPSQAIFAIKDEQAVYPPRIGYFSILDGEQRFVDACGYKFFDAVPFVDSNDHENVWVLGKCYEDSEKCEIGNKIVLIRSNENNCTEIASWPSKTRDYVGGDQPMAVLVSNEIIAVITSGIFWYGRGTLRYSLDRGLTWEEKWLPSSQVFKLSYDNEKKILNVVHADLFNFIRREFSILSAKSERP